MGKEHQGRFTASLPLLNSLCRLHYVQYIRLEYNPGERSSGCRFFPTTVAAVRVHRRGKNEDAVKIFEILCGHLREARPLRLPSIFFVAARVTLQTSTVAFRHNENGWWIDRSILFSAREDGPQQVLVKSTAFQKEIARTTNTIRHRLRGGGTRGTTYYSDTSTQEYGGAVEPRGLLAGFVSNAKCNPIAFGMHAYEGGPVTLPCPSTPTTKSPS